MSKTGFLLLGIISGIYITQTYKVPKIKLIIEKINNYIELEEKK